MGIEPPSPYEIKNKYLEMEYKEMEAYVNQQREKWKTYGCTIIIINFMVYSKGTTVFLKSVDASNYIKDHKYIYELLKTIIKEVGKENVVQIVTDNGSAFMKAGKQLMKKYNLYWTPCAAHCIDLIFEDIGKRPNVIEVINNARKITNFIYNHVVPTMPFVYELMHVMKENLIRQGAGDWMFKIIQDRWQKTLKHPLHAAAYFLNPRFQYRRGVGSDPELLQAVHDVFAKLDPTLESLGQFGNELVLFRDAKRGFGDRAAIASRSTMVPAEWWFMYGNQTPTLRKLAIKVLSQTASSSACERNWSTFALIHTKQRNRLAYPRLEQLVFCYYNMRLKLRDMEAENDRVAEKDYLDLLDISAEVGEEEDDRCSMEFGVNVERVLSEEVHSKVLAKIDDSLHATLHSHQEIDSQVLAIVVDLVCRTQFSDSSNEANVYPPHVMSYDQPSSSTNEEYGMSHYSPSRQMPYQIPYQMEEGFGVNTWVNFEYPIHVEAVGRTQEIYAWHVRIYNQYYRGSLTWYQYCLQQQAGVPSSINPIEPHRNSFWY
ncbi:hypothetical protein AAG906_007510 [Vitis piasezkii]